MTRLRRFSAVTTRWQCVSSADGPRSDIRQRPGRTAYAQAVVWYHKAADQGDAGAQFNLGFMYAQGRGVPQDYAQAHMWFSLADSRAPDAAVRGQAVKARDAVAAKMTPAQIAEAQRLASEWKPK